MSRLGRIVVAVVCLLGAGIGSIAGAGAGEFRWAEVAEEVVGHLDSAVAAVRAGDADAAKAAMITAYFSTFEDRKMEAALRKEVGQKHTAEVEQQFYALRKAISRGAGAAEVAPMAATLADALRASAKTLDERGTPQNVYKVP